jgi:hypothetical protein
VAGAAGGGWWRRGMAMKAAVARVESSYVFIKTEFWVLLAVGKWLVRKAGSLKYPPRNFHLHRN